MNFYFFTILIKNKFRKMLPPPCFPKNLTKTLPVPTIDFPTVVSFKTSLCEIKSILFLYAIKWENPLVTTNCRAFGIWLKDDLKVSCRIQNNQKTVTLHTLLFNNFTLIISITFTTLNRERWTAFVNDN